MKILLTIHLASICLCAYVDSSVSTAKLDLTAKDQDYFATTTKLVCDNAEEMKNLYFKARSNAIKKWEKEGLVFDDNEARDRRLEVLWLLDILAKSVQVREEECRQRHAVKLAEYSIAASKTKPADISDEDVLHKLNDYTTDYRSEL